ncbi:MULTISPECIES: hypothetical protein [unclassified Methylophaga]|uniref:hypothetical protein n=1 Tax=unclassified Methylophaga TaxID=2629249 RepID=UPI000C8C7CEC|nr:MULTISPECIES: hypothetical protein [unclassified Methylophaga]MAK66376.1 hypothetical protein [Methylophaga sp.]MAY17070.1 hypothetical protein [Methylophaga sp.]HAO26143.1 hypothetical protein [Methylophaga sp.]HCD06291.1 hypothetical protein [Methylophaga sp.]
MSESISPIGFSAVEDWTVEDFYRFFHQLNILYNRLYVLEKLKYKGQNPKLKMALYGSLSAVKAHHRLIIQSIEIHSPGDFNLLGLDKVIEQLRELWKDISYQNRLIKQKLTEQNRHNKQMNQLREIAAMQKLLQNQVATMQQLGYSEDEIAEGLKALADPLEQLIELADSRKISLKE